MENANQSKKFYRSVPHIFFFIALLNTSIISTYFYFRCNPIQMDYTTYLVLISGQIASIAFLLLGFLFLNHELLKHQRIEKNLKDKNEKNTLMLEMTHVILTCSSMKELGNIIAKYCEKILSFSTGSFYIMHPSKDYLEMTSHWGTSRSNTYSFTENECWGLRLGHIHYANFTNNELICEHTRIDGKKDLFYLCVPLRAQNDIFGLLYVEVSLKERAAPELTLNEKLLVNSFAELCALSLANIRLRENLIYQSVMDPLTSLYNRRYLEEFLTKQIHQSERTDRPIAVLLLDLDYFKRINDFYGHDAGDLVLKELGQLLIHETRSGDLASRYGGEEFIIVLYDTNLEAAAKRSEIIRKYISVMHVKYGPQEVGGITASIGVSMYPQDGKTSKELIEAADKALYVAKNSGRNKVVVFADI